VTSMAMLILRLCTLLGSTDALARSNLRNGYSGS
jgi:hypothetical protein